MHSVDSRYMQSITRSGCVLKSKQATVLYQNEHLVASKSETSSRCLPVEAMLSQYADSADRQRPARLSPTRSSERADRHNCYACTVAQIRRPNSDGDGRNPYYTARLSAAFQQASQFLDDVRRAVQTQHRRSRKDLLCDQRRILEVNRAARVPICIEMMQACRCRRRSVFDTNKAARSCSRMDIALNSMACGTLLESREL